MQLRPRVEGESLLKRAVDAGLEAAFANAYPEGWPGKGGSRRVAGPPLAARGAGLLRRHGDALARGEAISSEIVNDGWKRHLGRHDLPDITPEEAGANLAGIAADHHVTLYAHYTTDAAGHRKEMPAAVRALERVDAFLGGLFDHLSEDVLVVVASDHGNIEDVRVGHTRNPVLGLAAGPGAEEAAALGDIREVAGFLLRRLGVEPRT